LATTPASRTNKAFQERELEGQVKVLGQLGVPNWLVRTLLALRAWRASRTSSRTTE
jgi:hypothetical protein